ncbi:MAG: hypothetical protein ACKVZJ_02910 [Phycisphaerales bacterium]
MPKAKRKPGVDSWSAARSHMKDWSTDQFLGLLRTLFNADAASRAAILAVVTPKHVGADRAKSLEPLKKKIIAAANPPGYRQPHVPTARKVCADYYRATRDADGAVELYLTLIESAMAQSFEYGVDDGPFYDHLATACFAAAKLVPDCGSARIAREAAGRLENLLQDPNFPGWGMDEVLEDLMHEFRERAEALHRDEAARRVGDWEEDARAREGEQASCPPT